MCVCVCVYFFYGKHHRRIPKPLQDFYESAVGICFYDPTFVQTFQYINVICTTLSHVSTQYSLNFHVCTVHQ